MKSINASILMICLLFNISAFSKELTCKQKYIRSANAKINKKQNRYDDFQHGMKITAAVSAAGAAGAGLYGVFKDPRIKSDGPDSKYVAAGFGVITVVSSIAGFIPWQKNFTSREQRVLDLEYNKKKAKKFYKSLKRKIKGSTEKDILSALNNGFETGEFCSDNRFAGKQKVIRYVKDKLKKDKAVAEGAHVTNFRRIAYDVDMMNVAEGISEDDTATDTQVE